MVVVIIIIHNINCRNYDVAFGDDAVPKIPVIMNPKAIPANTKLVVWCFVVSRTVFVYTTTFRNIALNTFAYDGNRNVGM